MWPQYIMIGLLILRFIGDIRKRNAECLEKAQFMGVLFGITAYYALIIWLLHKGGFF